MKSATLILQNIRRDYKIKARFSKLMVNVFAAILLLDILILYYLSLNNVEPIIGFAQTGLSVLSALTIFSVFLYLSAVKDIKNLDEFYLEGEFDVKRRQKRPKKAA